MNQSHIPFFLMFICYTISLFFLFSPYGSKNPKPMVDKMISIPLDLFKRWIDLLKEIDKSLDVVKIYGEMLGYYQKHKGE